MKTYELFGYDYDKKDLNKLSELLLKAVEEFPKYPKHTKQRNISKSINYIKDLIDNINKQQKNIFTDYDLEQLDLLLCSSKSNLFKGLKTDQIEKFRTEIKNLLLQLKEASMVVMDKELSPSANEHFKIGDPEERLNKLRNLQNSTGKQAISRYGVYEQAGIDDAKSHGPSSKVAKEILFGFGSLIIQINNYKRNNSTEDLENKDSEMAEEEFIMIYQKLQAEYANIRENYYNLDKVADILKQVRLDFMETAKLDHMKKYPQKTSLLVKIVNSVESLLIKLKFLSESRYSKQYVVLSKSIKSLKKFSDLADKQSNVTKKKIEKSAKQSILLKKGPVKRDKI